MSPLTLLWSTTGRPSTACAPSAGIAALRSVTRFAADADRLPPTAEVAFAGGERLAAAAATCQSKDETGCSEAIVTPNRPELRTADRAAAGGATAAGPLTSSVRSWPPWVAARRRTASGAIGGRLSSCASAAQRCAKPSATAGAAHCTTTSVGKLFAHRCQSHANHVLYCTYLLARQPVLLTIVGINIWHAAILKPQHMARVHPGREELLMTLLSQGRNRRACQRASHLVVPGTPRVARSTRCCARGSAAHACRAGSLRRCPGPADTMPPVKRKPTVCSLELATHIHKVRRLAPVISSTTCSMSQVQYEGSLPPTGCSIAGAIPYTRRLAPLRAPLWTAPSESGSSAWPCRTAHASTETSEGTSLVNDSIVQS